MGLRASLAAGAWALAAGALWSAPRETPDEATLRLFDYDRDAPLAVEYRAFEDHEGFQVVDLTYASPDGGRVPAWLFVPEGEGPFAGLVVQHGMPGDRDSLRGVAERYVRTGAVVICPSAPCAREGREPRGFLTFGEQDRREQIQLIKDLRRAVDLLLQEPAVDPDRLGFVGSSYGGTMGGLLAGVEHRIRAYVLTIGDGGLVRHLTDPEAPDRAMVESLPPEQRARWLSWMEPIEPIHFVGLAAPSALLFQNSREDRKVPPAMAQRYMEAGSEPKALRWYDSPHGITPQMLRDQADWLAEHLHLDAARFPVTLPRSGGGGAPPA